MGAIVVSQIHLMKSTEFRLLLCQGKGKWDGQEVIDHHRNLGPGRGLRKIVLVDVSLVRQCLQIFDKQYILPLSPEQQNSSND